MDSLDEDAGIASPTLEFTDGLDQTMPENTHAKSIVHCRPSGSRIELRARLRLPRIGPPEPPDEGRTLIPKVLPPELFGDSGQLGFVIPWLERRFAPWDQR